MAPESAERDSTNWHNDLRDYLAQRSEPVSMGELFEQMRLRISLHEATRFNELRRRYVKHPPAQRPHLTRMRWDAFCHMVSRLAIECTPPVHHGQPYKRSTLIKALVAHCRNTECNRVYVPVKTTPPNYCSKRCANASNRRPRRKTST